MTTYVNVRKAVSYLASIACFLTLLATHATAVETATTPEKKIQPAVPEKVVKSAILKPFEARYTASIKGVPFGGSGSRSLKQNDNGSWTLEFGANATLFKMEETSTFFFKDNHIKSEQYTHERPGMIGSRPKETANFNWKEGKVNWDKEDKKWSFAIPEDAIDTLGYQVQLRLDLSAGKRENLKYQVVDDDEVYERTFIIEGEETIDTDAGKLETLRIKIQRDTDKRATWIWFAKNWDFFMVKFKQTENGSEYVIEFSEATIDGKPLKNPKS